jgi:hypothetical protein
MRETQGVMARQSLLEYFRPDSRPPREIAVAWRRGYRMVRWSYADLLRAATQFASQLDHRGIVHLNPADFNDPDSAWPA